MDVVEPASAPPPECGGAGESGRSSPSPAASPEFEFWMVGKNPSSFPSPALLTADELFSDGVVLPLHTLQAPPSDAEAEADAIKEEEADGEPTAPLAESGPAPTPDLPAVTFKWKDIFRAAGGGGGEQKDRKKMERRVSSVGGNAEFINININIWPFSRSRSAGHSAGGGALSRAKPNPNPSAIANASANAAPTGAPAAAAPAGRKVSSAPCSRSNSRGESSAPGPAATAVPPAPAAPAGPMPATSMLRRWVPGQGRAGAASGFRLGRASPVWQLRRNKLQQQSTAAAEQKQNGNATGAKKKPVPDDGTGDKAAPSVSAAAAGCRNNAGCSEGGEEGNPPQGLFGLRTFFSKKVY